MRKLFLRLAFGLVFIYLAGLAFHFAVSMVRFPATEVDAGTALQWRWVLSNTLIAYLSHFIPLHLSGVLISFALLLGAWAREKEDAQRPLYEIMQVAIVLFVGIGALYTIGYGIALPVAEQQRFSAVAETRFARTAFARALELEERGEYRAAAAEYRSYLSVHSHHAEISRHIERLLLRHDGTQAEVDSRPGRQDSARRPGGHSGAELIRRAEQAYEQEDYFTAHYFASLALPIGGEIEQEGRRLAAMAFREIERMGTDRRDARTAELFAEKRRGYEALQSGRVIDAYYIFTALAELAPGDRDVQRYLPIAREALESISFFADELATIDDYVSTSGVFFRVTRDDGTRLFVYIDLFTRSSASSYGRGVEAFQLSADGEPEFHLRAPYAKLIGGHLSLQALDREFPNFGYEAEYLFGEVPAETRNLLRLDLEPGELSTLAFASVPVGNIPLAVLLDLASQASEFGVAEGPVYLELYTRLTHPFSFVSLSFLAAGFGWRMRSRYLVPPVLPAIMALPLFPWVLAYAFSSYLYVNRLVLAVVIEGAGVSAGLMATVVVQSLVLVGTLLFMALQPAE